MIQFRCEHCGHKLSVPDENKGKRGKCPKCKNTLVVPEFEAAISPQMDHSADLKADSVNNGRLTLMDVPEEYKLRDKPVALTDSLEQAIEKELESAEKTEETESLGERRLPWFIDIFLYPISVSGLIHLGIFVVIPLLIAIVRFLMGPLGMAVGIPGFLINMAVGLYLLWYITECVRDSAKGGTRAPEAFATIGLGDMWSQAQHIIGCYLIFWGPVFFYHLYTRQKDIIYWLLLVCSAFFFPMGLLATIMFDSLRGLNPVLLISSIFSTIYQYCGLVILIVVVVVLAFMASTSVEEDEIQEVEMATFILGGVFYLFYIYIILVVAHLLGRFYWRYEDKLYWEV